MRRFLRFVCAALFLVTPFLPSCASAQNPVSNGDAWKITKGEAFDTIFARIAQQRHIAFVCEGQPLSLTLTDDQQKKLTESLQKPDLKPEEAISAIARAFDYDSALVSPTLCLLSKRYTDPEDFPRITFEEANISLNAILKIIQQFRPFNEFDALPQFYKSLNDSQRQAIANSIPISALSQEQQILVAHLASSVALRHLDGIQRMAIRLETCRTQAAFFTRDTIFETSVPCYKVPMLFRGNNFLATFALSRWIYTGTGGAISFNGEAGVAELQGDKLVANKPDPTTPLTKQVPPETLPLVHSLADTASQFTESLRQQAGTVKSVVVDDALARKTVLIIGQANSSVADLVQGIGKLYNLRVSRPDAKTLRLTFLTPHELRGPDEVGKEILRLLPAPISRFALSRKEIPWEHYTVAVRRLRQIIEPEIDKRDTGKVPFRETTDEGRDLVSISSLLTCVPEINRLQNPIQPYLQNLSAGNISLTAGPSDVSTQTHFHFQMLYRLPGQSWGVGGNMDINTERLKP